MRRGANPLGQTPLRKIVTHYFYFILKELIILSYVNHGVVLESMDIKQRFFRGYEPVTVARVALAFIKSIGNLLNGQVFRVL